jgi:hypothetical protein
MVLIHSFPVSIDFLAEAGTSLRCKSNGSPNAEFESRYGTASSVIECNIGTCAAPFCCANVADESNALSLTSTNGATSATSRTNGTSTWTSRTNGTSNGTNEANGLAITSTSWESRKSQ